MAKLVCSKCKQEFKEAETARCPKCGSTAPHVYDFENSEEYLNQQVHLILEEQKDAGLEGLVGGLDSVIINVKAKMQVKAVKDLLHSTGPRINDAFGKWSKRTFVLGGTVGADFLITIRTDDNPFQSVSNHPRTSHLPNTRLETFFSRHRMLRNISTSRDHEG
ncbi:MAG: hydrogenase maturation nickel metallochaperone HypA [Methanomassiliicoccales archaeon]|nr:hydrogenase maturation nickel metallochaperone HypA [Methanomassiliicoccales archaeon]NYT14853.1 hydrogenase maturation nickel metallochaperone HypA [Methanomassiliicoccales archaeon]